MANLVSTTKLGILTGGVELDVSVFENAANYKREDYSYNNSHKGTDKEHKIEIPQEITLSDCHGHDTTVSTVTYKDARYLLKYESGAYGLYDRESESTVPLDVGTLVEPEYRSKKTSLGVPMNRIISNCGSDEINVWLWHDCMYPYMGKTCRFCGINSVSSRYKNIDMLKSNEFSQHNFKAWWKSNRNSIIENSVESVAQALKTKTKTGHTHLIFTAGSTINDSQWEMYYTVMKEINERVVRLNHINTTVILTPPKNLSYIDKCGGLGAEFAFNMEVFSREAFKYMVPGKEAYVGYDNYFTAYKHAVEVAGEGRVWCGFVLGLEPIKNLVEGIKYLNSIGVASGANVLHIDEGNSLPAGIRLPPMAEILSFYSEYGNLERRYNYKPFFCQNAMRTSLNHEAFMGWI